ncbi:MAG: acyl-CoA desaturase [Gammaproteobacteria bacterium]|nr:acyl-CoA desaturase [Gammaproteobacteria bacterium]
MLETKLISTERMRALPDTDNQTGEILWNPTKSLFYCGMCLMGLVAVPFAGMEDWIAFALLTGVTILAGHSVGMHRLLIHRSFRTSRYLEFTLVYLGVLVGMAGPVGMIRLHDARDWHQRQLTCPPYPSHATSFWQDAWWQLHCSFYLDKPPEFVLENSVADSKFYEWLERTWMLQQIPIALVLFYIGGWTLMCIGVGLRVFVSLTGHWLVGHFAHKRGQQRWVIGSLPVQGYNLPYLSWITFGENWHGNHHAFPESALLGVEANQSDPGYCFIRLLENLGLVWSIQLPEHTKQREGLRLVN